MNHNRLPAVALGLICVGYLTFIAGSSSQLPERVASHFGIDGQPNGWMPRELYLHLIAGIGLGVTALFVGLAGGFRFFPARSFNLPRRDYWLAPERRAETVAWLRGAMLWFSCLILGFLGGIHYLTIEANRSQPAHLPGVPSVTLVAAFVIATIGWSVILFRHFSKSPESHLTGRK